MKKHLVNFLLILIFVIGLGIFLYPTIADLWNSRTQSRVVADYKSAVENLTEEDFEDLFAIADKYNEDLRNLNYPLVSYDQIKGYDEALNLNGDGVMGYIKIDKINLELPIYHGTSDSVLSVAIGHLTGSSLPTGGESNHAVLSGHRGLPSAELFTRLDKLEEGDYFELTILNRTLYYEVDQIHIVEPGDTSDLSIVRGEDYCTLLTCTPYGINSHRLLVRGHRVDGINGKDIPAEAVAIDTRIITPILASPILLVLLIGLLIKYRKKKKS